MEADIADFMSPTAPSDDEDVRRNRKRTDTIALELDDIANESCPMADCSDCPRKCPICSPAWDCYKTCMGLMLCGEVSGSIIRKTLFYLMIAILFLIANFVWRDLRDLTQNGYMYPEFHLLYERILETVNLLMAFYVFGVIERARDIEVALLTARDQHKKALDNLFALGGITTNAVGREVETAFRQQIAKWLVAGFAFWTNWADEAALPVERRQRAALMMVEDGILTKDEYDSLYDRTSGEFVRCHRIMYAWCTRLTYDILLQTTEKDSGLPWDTCNEILSITAMLEKCIANRNADFSFAYQEVVESFIILFNLMSTFFLSYFMLQMAAAGDFVLGKAMKNYGAYAPIVTYALNITFFSSLHAVAKEAQDPLDDQTHNQMRYYLLIRELKHDLFAIFKTLKKTPRGDSSADLNRSASSPYIRSTRQS